jgi:hypothetical protein
MTFARRVFLIAGIYGLIVLLPQYFLEAKNGADFPPAITHSEYYYGFVGVGLAWQVAFLILSRDPVRYRAFMIPAVLEKLGFGAATTALYLLGRLSASMFAAGLIDLALGALFVVSYVRTPASWRSTDA